MTPTIWEWRAPDPLEPTFKRLVAAPEARFEAVGSALHVSEFVEKGMLTPEEAATFAEQVAAAEAPGSIGSSPRIVATATSFPFFDEPYASLDHSEIDAQVDAEIRRLRDAASAALGDDGRAFWAEMAARPEAVARDARLDRVIDAPLDGFRHVWLTDAAAFIALGDHEDKELPIHVGFGRMSRQTFEDLRATIANAVER